MEPTVQLPALLAALMACVMLAGFIEAIAASRKVRDDRRRYQQRIRRDHGAPQPERQAPPDA
jgi:hypothetical protein